MGCMQRPANGSMSVFRWWRECTYLYNAFVGIQLKLKQKLMMIETLVWVQLKLELNLMMVETLV